MSIDYLVASLPALVFGNSAPITYERFEAAIAPIKVDELLRKWREIETELKNELVELRAAKLSQSGKRVPDKAKYLRPSERCSIFLKSRLKDAYQIEEVAARDEAIDRVFWEAAAEMTPPESPLGKGALATYAARLLILLKRSQISTEGGNAAFDRLTEKTRI